MLYYRLFLLLTLNQFYTKIDYNNIKIKGGKLTITIKMIITVEGNIGSGKSTLVENLKRHLSNKEINYVFVQEPVDIWSTICDKEGEPILTKFYRDQERYSFSFQMMAYISRLSILRKAVKENPNSVIITERCVHTDRNVFAQMLYDDEKILETDYQIYLRWFDEFIEDVPIYGYIYLKTTPQTSFERVKKRQREGELIPIEYLDRCNNYHDMWLDNIPSDKKIIIDGNTDIDEKPHAISLWMTTIHQWVIGEIYKTNKNKLVEERPPLNFIA